MSFGSTIAMPPGRMTGPGGHPINAKISAELLWFVVNNLCVDAPAQDLRFDSRDGLVQGRLGGLIARTVPVFLSRDCLLVLRIVGRLSWCCGVQTAAHQGKAGVGQSSRKESAEEGR